MFASISIRFGLPGLSSVSRGLPEESSLRARAWNARNVVELRRVMAEHDVRLVSVTESRTETRFVPGPNWRAVKFHLTAPGCCSAGRPPLNHGGLRQPSGR